MSDELDQLADAALSERVAVEVAGWRAWFEERGGYTHFVWQKAGEREPWMGTQRHEEAKKRYRPAGIGQLDRMKHCYYEQPNYATSADAVLPLAGEHWEAYRVPGGFGFKITNSLGEILGAANASTLERAVCIALLRRERAKRAEKGGVS